MIVVGGGAIGLAISWKAASLGAKVRLVDPAPGSGASGMAAGMLAPVTELHYGEEDLLALNLASSELYPEWVAELERFSGAATGFRPCGTMMVARDRDDNLALEELFRFQAKLALKVDRLTGPEARSLEPALASNTRGAILIEGDHQIDPAMLTAALRIACEKSGVDFVVDRAAALTLDGELRTESGEDLNADVVVLAAGAASATIEGVGELLPIRPVKGQLVELRTEPNELPIDRNVRGLDVYLVPRADGRLVIGATVEEKGWDQSATAGAVHDLLHDAYELVPDVAEMTFSGVRVGFRPGTPTMLRCLGRLSEHVIVATGHFRNGILLTPITGDTIAQSCLHGDRGGIDRSIRSISSSPEERVSIMKLVVNGETHGPGGRNEHRRGRGADTWDGRCSQRRGRRR